VVTAEIQTTMISESITAYSTAVGPSSFFKNDNNFLMAEYMARGDLSVAVCEAKNNTRHSTQT
jgi:hypothetical protein